MNSHTRPRIALIAAVAANGVIGKDGKLPWHLSADMRHFKALTTGKRIIMGRKTWESFPKPLPDREHVVVSSSNLTLPDGVRLCRSVSEAFALPDPTDPVFVIGGNRLYAEALAFADDLYLTQIDAEVDGDTVFPPYARGDFEEHSRQTHTAALRADGAPVRFHFVHYQRCAPIDVTSA
ncbi:MAG: dihydrofolate reductase [Betaproteobacteria bacterium]|nr:MAG: dihydrofolate reductase [Betaproteobacteria bacterium]